MRIVGCDFVPELDRFIHATCVDLSQVEAVDLAIMLGMQLQARDEQHIPGQHSFLVFATPCWDEQGGPTDELELIILGGPSRVVKVAEIDEAIAMLQRAS